MKKIEVIRNHTLAFHIHDEKYVWFIGFAKSENDIAKNTKMKLNFCVWNIENCDDIKGLKTTNFEFENECNEDSKVVYMFLEKV